MARSMKVTTVHTYEDGDTLIKWYDPSYGWVIAAIDHTTGYQITEADYVGHKTALQAHIDYRKSHKPVATYL